MRKYELMCVLTPELDDNAVNSFIEKTSGWVSEAGGTVDKVDLWGRRRMAYMIRKQREGLYVLLNLSMPSSASATLDRNLRLTENVMRYMITAVE